MIPCVGLGSTYGLAPTIPPTRTARHGTFVLARSSRSATYLAYSYQERNDCPSSSSSTIGVDSSAAPAEHEHARQVHELLQLRAALGEAQRGARARLVELHRQPRAAAPVDRAERGHDVRDAALELGHVGLAQAEVVGLHVAAHALAGERVAGA